MTRNKFIIKNNIKSEIRKFNKKKFINKFFYCRKKILNEIDTELNNFHVLSKRLKLNFDNKELKKFKKFQNIVLIGMGGSILGAEAIHKFLEHKVKKHIEFFDDLNLEKVENFKKNINLKKTLFIIISKSGSTTETLSNFLSLNIIKKNSKNIILISEKKNNFLFNLSKKFNLFHIEHKNFVGGRYSVLTEVGLIPALFMGLKIKKLRKNVKKYLQDDYKNLLKTNIISFTNIISQKKFKNLILFNYSPRLEKVLYWLQQLIAESLGKKGLGLLPVISNAPKDHHSLLQLYLDGPKDKIFYIFDTIEKSKKKLNVKKYLKNNYYLHNKTLSKIKNCQKRALLKVLRKNKIPFKVFEIKKFNEEIIGEIFSYFILETAISGKLLGINPFDQPAVEDVKKQTINFLN